jgi:ADP-ribosylglycohydrolase
MTTKINPNKLREQSLGCILGVAIGDALGLPVECKSPDVIRSLFGYVDEYKTNKHHLYPNVARRAPGTFSDDTQLTLAVMDSIARIKGYDINDIKKAHIEAMDGKWGVPIGWGRSTRNATQKMKNGQSDTAEKDGAGNGPCMKISPLAIYAVYKTLGTSHGKFTNAFNYSLLKKCHEISSITHGDIRCAVATYCQTRMIIRALQGEPLDHTKWISQLFIDDAKFAENKLKCNLDPISARLEYFLSEEMFSLETSIISKKICTEQSSFIMNSYPLVAYCVSKYLPYRNFNYAIFQTVNAGADADSNASMVGAIVGAYLGYTEINSELIGNLKNCREIIKQVKLFLMAI